MLISRSRESLLGTVLLTGLAPVLWGTTYWTTSEVLPPDRPLLAATLRALPVGVLIAVALRAVPQGIWWGRAFVLGTLNMGAFFALLFVAAYRLPGGAAATLIALQPLFALGLAALWLSARPRRLDLLAATAGAAGVTLVVGGAPGGLDAGGVAAALGAAVSMAAGVVLTKRWKPPVSSLAFAGWQLTAGGLVVVPLLLAVEGVPASMTVREIAGMTYLAVLGTGLAYALWLRGIARLPVAGVSMLALFSPLTATVIGWLTGEPVAALQVAGGALILGGVTAIQVRPAAPAAPVQPLPATPSPAPAGRLAA